jgi:hypothetical protein
MCERTKLLECKIKHRIFNWLAIYFKIVPLVCCLHISATNDHIDIAGAQSSAQPLHAY